MNTVYNRCPKCGSENVLVGAFVLSCFACDWNHNNEHPCSVCGQPAYGCGGSQSDGVYAELYGCREHPVTTEALKKEYHRLKELKKD